MKSRLRWDTEALAAHFNFEEMKPGNFLPVVTYFKSQPHGGFFDINDILSLSVRKQQM